MSLWSFLQAGHSLLNSQKSQCFTHALCSVVAGFSRQIVEIMKDHNIKYSSFDILSDEEVRQGLKTYSNWPTYPQVYVNGELVGGLDIIKVRSGARRGPGWAGLRGRVMRRLPLNSCSRSFPRSSFVVLSQKKASPT